MFRGPRGLVFTLLGAAAVIALAITFGFRGQKADVEISRNFLNHLATGEFDEAYALLHPSIRGQLTLQELSASVAGMQPYSDISFPSFSFSTSNGTRETELTGTGITASGCESALEFGLLDGIITYFDISPLCLGTGTDA